MLLLPKVKCEKTLHSFKIISRALKLIERPRVQGQAEGFQV